MFLGTLLEPYYGPFRLFTSHFFLLLLGASVAFGLTWRILPMCFGWLPRDRGRSHAVNGHEAHGKPTGAGVVFISVCCGLTVCVMPAVLSHYLLLGLTWVTMLAGFLDDRSAHPWGELRKGSLDLVLAISAALILAWDAVPLVWLPFTTAVITPSRGWFVIMATVIIWGTINTTNCSDGVDGLSGTMVALAGSCLVALLYGILGHVAIAQYLRVPYSSTASSWAICLLTFVGGLGGYLWHNAYPSRVLMGDAGSRALGFLLGVTILKTGNPCILLVTSHILWLNGGAGLLKLACLRLFRLHLFPHIRCPLHDYFRHVRGWSNTQVVIRFTLAQVLTTGILLGILLKIR
jgi:phospho-N-acetylmuramoyl-pentapeptide-transferase